VEWDDEERAWILALADYEANQCGGCGGQIDETTSKVHEDHWVVPPPVRCFKCTELARAQAPFREVNKNTGKPLVPHSHALLWQVTKQ
jgi:hypothetical protein